MRALKILCGAAALAAFLAPPAHADDWNKRTYLTFSGPVQMPGATLPAGTYTFELANPDSTRHLIRVSEKETNKPIGMFLTIPNERLAPPSENLVMFAERPAGSPQAIQVWFYPGDKIGEEFVYPKSQAIAIAKANHQPVLATTDEGDKNASEADRMAAMRGASVGRVDENGRMTSDESKPAVHASTTTADNEKRPSASTTAAPANTVDGSRQARTDQSATADRPAQAPRSTTARSSRNTVGTSGQTDAAQNGNRRRQLPRTAGHLAALELISALAFTGAIATRRLRRAAEAR
jgi:hypothetical protein